MTMNMKWMPVPMLRLKKVDLADGKIMRRDITVTREAWLWDGSETCYRCKRPIMPDDLVLVMDCGATTPRKMHRMCLGKGKTFAAWEAAREHCVFEGIGACDPGIDCKDRDEPSETDGLPAWVGEIRRTVIRMDEQPPDRVTLLPVLDLIDLAANMAEQLVDLQIDLRQSCLMRGSKWHAMGCNACNQTTCAGKLTEDLLHWWEGEANGQANPRT